MSFTFDFERVAADPLGFIWWFFITIGWIFPVFLFCWGLIIVWQNNIRNKYRKTRRYILLAIDIPKNNEQSPRAVENIFAHLAGAHKSFNFYEQWWTGEVDDSFSFEIISIGGYIQFIVHTRDVYRDLIEASVYAQYPDAEITEIEDYAQRWKLQFPNDQYDLYGAELKLAKKSVYPIITYKEFEDTLSGELKDPMASILEALTRITPGEEIWIQLVITPADNNWGRAAKPIIDKIIGAEGEQKKDIFFRITSTFNYVLDALTNPAAGEGSIKKEAPNKMQFLTPGEKDAVAAIQHKISRTGFYTRIRYVYIAEKPKFLKQRGAQGILGGFKQFNDLELNSFKTNKKYTTGGVFWLKDRRLAYKKGRILRRFKDRGQAFNPGSHGFILNTEELASLWHFPMMTVKAPLMKMAETKKAEPPMTLPLEVPEEVSGIVRRSTPTAEPPADLPVEPIEPVNDDEVERNTYV